MKLFHCAYNVRDYFCDLCDLDHCDSGNTLRKTTTNTLLLNKIFNISTSYGE